MRGVLMFTILSLAILAGGTLGGVLGWTLGDFGGRSDPENVWAISLLSGAVWGGATATVVSFTRMRGWKWATAGIAGVVCGALCGAAVVIVLAS